jgi:twitching motility protein PilT
MILADLLEQTKALNASDLHLSVGAAPWVRIDGQLKVLDVPVITATFMQQMLQVMLTQTQQDELHEKLELDLAITSQSGERYRVNIFHQQTGLAAALRRIPSRIPSLEEIGLHTICHTIGELRNGLVLITGATGSGKSTTLAAILNYINQTQQKHIISIEDPIEFIHQNQQSLIQQRELYTHTHSFSWALRAALREDPDIILIGEMRDLETIRLALSAAETGHLVFATLHTASAVQAVDRIIEVFPGEERTLIRTLLSESLRAIMAQVLVPKRDGGRVAIQEVLFNVPAVRNLIRENKLPQIYSILQTNRQQGMQTLDQHLQQAVKQQFITAETAAVYAIDKNLFV